MDTLTPNPDSLPEISPVEPKKTRKALQDKIRQEKATLKAARKATFRRKTEKKLAEKAERKIAHKKNNAQRKLEKKIQARTIGPDIPERRLKKKA